MVVVAWVVSACLSGSHSGLREPQLYLEIGSWQQDQALALIPLPLRVWRHCHAEGRGSLRFVYGLSYKYPLSL